MKMKTQQPISDKTFYCPMCDRRFATSEYLSQVFGKNPKLSWFANMVTHYRHNHIVSWDKCWGRNGHLYMRGWFFDYETEKQKVNERAKRQIIRKCKDYMFEHSIDVMYVKMLQNTTEQTIKLAEKEVNKQHIDRTKKCTAKRVEQYQMK